MEKKQRLIEIYKLHVDLSNKVSERRGQTNMFYITLLSGMIALLSFSDGSIMNLIHPNLILFIIGLIGVLLCIIWYFNIHSYRQLNSGKFKTLHELEQKIDYPFFEREWELLGKGKKSKIYFQLSRVEQFTPLLLIIPYLIILIYSIL